MAEKPKVATASLAGCFGCHMSLLDIDDRILKLVELVDFDKSPVDDIKTFTSPCAVGLIEGGCCNEENVENLRDFREHCEILIAVGDCATMGGIPALRNNLSVKECLAEAYSTDNRLGPAVHNPENIIPNDPELPLLLDRVYPIQEVVKIDYFLPGCPPPADTLWEALVALLTDKPVDLPYELIKYD
jgi:NAD-reducing hydrogenase small subunit